jgi:FHA domain-containing protein
VGAYLEVSGPAGQELVPLVGERFTIGRNEGNDLVISIDRTVSGAHAVLERFPFGWSIRDVGSRNGTFVNGERLVGERALHPGDEIRLGRARVTFKSDQPADRHHSVTEAGKPAPELTRREREVLMALCRPLLSGSLFTAPATIRDVAAQLFVTEAAVKQHLLRLYDKFEIYEGSDRRVRLANEAVIRGAVTLSDLRAQPE